MYRKPIGVDAEAQDQLCGLVGQLKSWNTQAMRVSLLSRAGVSSSQKPFFNSKSIIDKLVK
jgi:hypothetical protein